MNSWLQGQRLLLILIVVSLLCLSSGGCAPSTQEKIELKVICAGSLMVPFTEIEKAYEAQNPHVDVLTEGHGSVQVIRQVTELGAEADVIAVADHSLIPAMMYDVKIPDSDASYANWYVQFASNTLGLAYTSGSRYADEINADNWYEILARPDVKLGISDPRFDACGYRAMMACWLAGLLYDDHDIFHDVLGAFDYPITPQVEGRQCTILVPEIIRPQKVSVRGSSVVLLGILESGDIDYAFEYKSVAQQRDLHFVELPPEINLGSDDFQSLGYDLSVKALCIANPGFCLPGDHLRRDHTGEQPPPRGGPELSSSCSDLKGSRYSPKQYQPFRFGDDGLVVDNAERIPDDLKDLLESGQ